MDWTKVIGSIVLLAGGICMKVFTNLPDALVMTVLAPVPALWVLPTVGNILGINYRGK
jgi:hypothetical protein